MSKTVYTKPDTLQMGDRIVVKNQECSVNYVGTPDSIGTYDVYVVDPSGQQQHEIITGLVRIVV